MRSSLVYSTVHSEVCTVCTAVFIVLDLAR
eukprot:COSAG01_NODE_18240_length_1090_cov_1.529768_1_plen_29_part_10